MDVEKDILAVHCINLLIKIHVLIAPNILIINVVIQINAKNINMIVRKTFARLNVSNYQINSVVVMLLAVKNMEI